MILHHALYSTANRTKIKTIWKPVTVQGNEFRIFTLKELGRLTCPVRLFKLSSIEQLMFPTVVKQQYVGEVGK